MRAGKAASVCAVVGGPWAACEPPHLSQVSTRAEAAAALALAAPWPGWFGHKVSNSFYGVWQGPKVLMSYFGFFSVGQRSSLISSGPQSRCVGDSYNQHRGAYTVDEQKQLLKKKKRKYIILFLGTGI